MSALNVDKVKDSEYASSKLEGERLAKEYFKDITIIRPGVVLEREIILLIFFITFQDLALYSLLSVHLKL